MPETTGGREIPDPETNAKQAIILQGTVDDDVNHASGLCTPAADLFESIRYAADMDPITANMIRGNMMQFFLRRRAAIMKRAGGTDTPMERWPELHEAERACIEGGSVNFDSLSKHPSAGDMRACIEGGNTTIDGILECKYIPKDMRECIEGGAMNMARLRELCVPKALAAVEYRSPEPAAEYSPDALADAVTRFILEFSDGAAPVLVDRVCGMVDANRTSIDIEYDCLKRCPVLENHLRREPDRMRAAFGAGLKEVTDIYARGYAARKEAEYPGLTKEEAASMHRNVRSVFRIRISGWPDVVAARRVDPSVKGRLVTIPGIVETIMPPHPRTVARVYYCTIQAHHKTTVIQDPNPNTDTPKPATCPGENGVLCKGRLVEEPNESRQVQTQIVRIRELDNGRDMNAPPRRMDLHLENGLVGGLRDAECVYVTGIVCVKREPIRGRPKMDDGVGSYYSDVWGVEYVDGLGNRTATRVERDKVGAADIEEINKRRKDPDCLQWAMGIMSPQLVGEMYNVVRKALIYSECSPLTYEKRALTGWGRTNILLVGDPGTGKTVMLRGHARLVSGARYLNAGMMSGAGFGGAAGKNERTGRFEPVPGAAALCDRSTVCVDEGNRWRKVERQARNEVMQSGTVTDTKAHYGGPKVWKARTAIFEACNASTVDGYMRPYDESKHLVDNLLAYDQSELTRFGLLVRFPGKFDRARMIDGLEVKGNKKELDENERLLRLWFLHARKGEPELPDSVWRYARKRYLAVTDECDPRLIADGRMWYHVLQLAVGSANFWGVSEVRIEDVDEAMGLITVCRDAAAPEPGAGQSDLPAGMNPDVEQEFDKSLDDVM